MDIDTARATVRSAFGISSDLQALLPILRRGCGVDEYKEYAIDIARAIDAVNVALLHKALKAYPELEREIERRISTQGRFT